MRIAYIYPEKLPSKKARGVSATNTCSELSKMCDITLFIENSSKEKEAIEKFYSLDCPNLMIEYINKSFLGIRSNKFFNRNLLKNMKKENFDVFYIRHLKTADLLIRSRAKNSKIIFECHEIFQKTNPKIAKIENKVYKNVDGLVFINETLQKEFNKFFLIGNISQIVVHNGCGFNSKYIEKDFSKLEDIYYIGNFYPWKGVEFAVKAMRYLPHLKLKIIGDGDRKEKLVNMVKELNIDSNIEFLGYKSQCDIKAILKKAKLTIIPNIPSEFSKFSSPIKLYEYMMTSNIIIASDTPPIKEIINNGQNGFLFESGNLNSLVNVIKEVLSMSNKTLKEVAKNAYETSQEFTWENRAKKLLKFIKTLTNK